MFYLSPKGIILSVSGVGRFSCPPLDGVGGGFYASLQQAADDIPHARFILFSAYHAKSNLTGNNIHTPIITAIFKPESRGFKQKDNRFRLLQEVHL